MFEEESERLSKAVLVVFGVLCLIVGTMLVQRQIDMTANGYMGALLHVVGLWHFYRLGQKARE